MTTKGLDDEILMLLPFVIVPIQLSLIVKIMSRTPFMVRSSVRHTQLMFTVQLKKFVTKYTVAMASLMITKCS